MGKSPLPVSQPTTLQPQSSGTVARDQRDAIIPNDCGHWMHKGPSVHQTPPPERLQVLLPDGGSVCWNTIHSGAPSTPDGNPGLPVLPNASDAPHDIGMDIDQESSGTAASSNAKPLLQTPERVKQRPIERKNRAKEKVGYGGIAFELQAIPIEIRQKIIEFQQMDYFQSLTNGEPPAFRLRDPYNEQLKNPDKLFVAAQAMRAYREEIARLSKNSNVPVEVGASFVGELSPQTMVSEKSRQIDQPQAPSTSFVGPFTDDP